MSQRNATASWSGYSHQGQVGLLIAIRELKNDFDLDKHFVAFESREDVTIYSLRDDGEKEYKSVHQVKAYYSSGNHLKNTYSSVLNDHFDKGSENYLHTVVDIKDWSSTNTTNKNNVVRYKYAENKFYCDTTEIEKIINSELLSILDNNESFAENAHKNLSFKLDHKIREEHKKGKKALFDIKFSLQEIRNFIFDQSIFRNEAAINCRKLFYNLFIEAKKDEDYNDKQLQEVEKIINRIYSFSDDNFLTFLQRLSLNRDPSELKLTHTTYNHDGLKQVFYNILLETPHIPPKIDENNLTIVYMSLRYMLTTIIEEKRDAKKVVKNILNNLDNNKLLWEKVSLINKEIDGSFQQLNPVFFDIQMKSVKDSKEFMQYNGSTSLISRETAKENLKNGKVNSNNFIK